MEYFAFFSLLVIGAILLYIMYCQVQGNCGRVTSRRRRSSSGTTTTTTAADTTAAAENTTAADTTAELPSWWSRNWSTVLWVGVGMIGVILLWYLFGALSTITIPSMGGSLWYLTHGITCILLIWRALRVTAWDRYHVGIIGGLAFVSLIGGFTLVPQLPEIGWLIVTGIIPLLIAEFYAFTETPESVRGVAYATLGALLTMFTYIIMLSQGSDWTPALVIGFFLGAVLAGLLWWMSQPSSDSPLASGVVTGTPLITIDTTGRARSGNSWLTILWLLLALIIVIGLITYLDGGMMLGTISANLPKIGLGLLILALIIAFFLAPTSWKVGILILLGIAVAVFGIIFALSWLSQLAQWLYAFIGTNIFGFAAVFTIFFFFVTTFLKKNWNIQGFIVNIVTAVLIIGIMSAIFGFPLVYNGSLNGLNWPSWPTSGPVYTDPGWTR